MSKKAKKKSMETVADAAEPPELAAEVRALAAQLGLGAAGGLEHAFDDFAPKQAKQKLGKASKRKADALDEAEELDSGSGGADGDAAAAKAAKVAVRKQRAADKAAAAGARGKQADQAASVVPPVSDAMAAAIKERQWNLGAGPRPGEGKRSLLDRDAPALWYEALAALPPLPAAAKPPDEAQVAEARARGEALLEREAAVFEQELGRKNGQDARWLQQVRRSGTTSDKVAAITLLLQESAVANVKALDQLVGWVARRKGGRTVVGQAVDAGREIFATALLPDRKLRWLGQQPLGGLAGGGREGERRLLLWTLEDALKQRYGAFVAALEEGSRDNLEWVKERALKAAAELLRAKPEGEAQLLSLLVNKLGDPSRKVASKAGYLLSGVLADHPGMKAVVVAEVSSFLFRPGLQERARYYAVVFLNQLQLSHHPTHGGGELAKKLIDMYMTLFQLIITGKVGHAAAAQRAAEERAEAAKLAGKKGGKKKGGPGGKGGKHRQHKHPPKKGAKAAASTQSAEEVDARMLGALVAGVRRAFPYVDAGEVEDVIDKHSDSLFRITHTAPLGVSLQVLALMLQLMAGRRAVSDRFYRALYAVMLSPEVGRTSKAPMFVSLVFKAMKADVSIKRVAAFAKRLLQVALQSPGPFAAGTLFLLSEVLKAKSPLWTAILQPAEAADDVEHFRDAPDPDDAPAAAPSAAAALQPAASQLNGHRADGSDAEGSDDDAMGAAEPDPVAAAAAANAAEQDEQQAAAADKAGSPGEPAGGLPWPAPGAYDMHKREPAHCGAETSCWWELDALAKHAHPSVTAMAGALLAGASVVYDGDPLRDLALAAFLDKFVRRKAKTRARGGSVMQPLGRLQQGGNERAAAAIAAEPGTSAFAALAAADVKPDAVFFHKFYAAREAKKPAKAARPEAGDASDASDASDAEIDRLLDDEEEIEGNDATAPDAEYDYSALADACDDSASEGGSGSDEEAGSDDISEDVNPFELAEPTTSDEGSGSDDEMPDFSDAGGSDSDEEMGAFASADDWAARIDERERAAGGSGSSGSEDSGSEAAEAAPPRQKRRKVQPAVQMPDRRGSKQGHKKRKNK